MTDEVQKKAASLDPFANIDIPIEHAGHAITLPAEPAKMSKKLAIETLKKKMEEEESPIGVHESVDAFPFDGAVAFMKAMRDMFGWVQAVPTPGFFGPTPPTTKDVAIGPNETIPVIWGRFEIPGIPGYVECGGENTKEGPRFVINGTVLRKDHPTIRQLAERTRHFARTESIYRGKAISLSVDNDGDVEWFGGIGFVDLSNVNPGELVFSASTETQITTSVWTPIEYTELCREHKIPLKRGVLLSGKYGTGKTLTANVTAMKCRDNGWTFLTINRVSGLAQALSFARKFQPCVIFAEDIDRAVSGDERTVEIDDILNVIDGIGSKGTEIMVVLTTNHLENINQAMLRPGRLDAVVNVTAPDAAAVRRLVRLYGRSLVAQDDTLLLCGAALEGQIPAVIRECVERAKLYAIGHAEIGQPLSVKDVDIAAAAEGMRQHIALLTKEKEEPDYGALDRAFRLAVRESLGNASVERLESTAAQMLDEVSSARKSAKRAERYSSRAMEIMSAAKEGVDSTAQLTEKTASRVIQIHEKVVG